MWRQNGVTELLFEDMDRRLEMKCHPKLMGDQLGLIDFSAAGPSNIDFLKANNVGFAGGDDPDDAAGRQLTVKPKASVNIVGQNSGQIG